MSELGAKIHALLEPTVVALGYEFVGCELCTEDKELLLRLFIDCADGITVGDCEQVSRQVGAILDVEDLIKTNYNLEVSSPGLDRPLFNKGHYERFAGHKIKIKLYDALADRRNFTGMLQDVVADEIVILVDGEEYKIPLSNIKKGNLVPNFDE